MEYRKDRVQLLTNFETLSRAARSALAQCFRGPYVVHAWVRASASQLVDQGFIPQVKSYQKTLNNGIHSFPAWRSAHRDSVESKPASLLVVFLGKTFNGMPPSLCGRQVAGRSSLTVVVAQSDERHAN